MHKKLGPLKIRLNHRVFASTTRGLNFRDAMNLTHYVIPIHKISRKIRHVSLGDHVESWFLAVTTCKRGTLVDQSTQKSLLEILAVYHKESVRKRRKIKMDLTYCFLNELLNVVVFRKGSWSTEQNKSAEVLFVLISNSTSKRFYCTFP